MSSVHFSLKNSFYFAITYTSNTLIFKHLSIVYLLIWMEYSWGRWIERKRERKIFHPRVCCPNGCNGQGWNKPKLGALSGSPTCGAKVQAPGPSSAAYRGSLTGNWIRNRVAKTWARAQMGRSHYRQCLYPLKHSIGPSRLFLMHI